MGLPAVSPRCARCAVLPQEPRRGGRALRARLPRARRHGGSLLSAPPQPVPAPRGCQGPLPAHQPCGHTGGLLGQTVGPGWGPGAGVGGREVRERASRCRIRRWHMLPHLPLLACWRVSCRPPPHSLSHTHTHTTIVSAVTDLPACRLALPRSQMNGPVHEVQHLPRQVGPGLPAAALALEDPALHEAPTSQALHLSATEGEGWGWSGRGGSRQCRGCLHGDHGECPARGAARRGPRVRCGCPGSGS